MPRVTSSTFLRWLSLIHCFVSSLFFQYRQKLREAQACRVADQRAKLTQRQDESNRVDRRIAELQERLHRKRFLNHQLAVTLKHQVNFNNEPAYHWRKRERAETRSWDTSTKTVAGSFCNLEWRMCDNDNPMMKCVKNSLKFMTCRQRLKGALLYNFHIAVENLGDIVVYVILIQKKRRRCGSMLVFNFTGRHWKRSIPCYGLSLNCCLSFEVWRLIIKRLWRKWQLRVSVKITPVYEL